MTAEFYPCSVRRNKRSHAAIRIVMPDPNGGTPYEHRVYSSWRNFATGAEARKCAADMIAAPDFDAEHYVSELKAAWGL